MTAHRTDGRLRVARRRNAVRTATAADAWLGAREGDIFGTFTLLTPFCASIHT